MVKKVKKKNNNSFLIASVVAVGLILLTAMHVVNADTNVGIDVWSNESVNVYGNIFSNGSVNVQIDGANLQNELYQVREDQSKKDMHWDDILYMLNNMGDIFYGKANYNAQTVAVELFTALNRVFINRAQYNSDIGMLNTRITALEKTIENLETKQQGTLQANDVAVAYCQGRIDAMKELNLFSVTCKNPDNTTTTWYNNGIGITPLS